MSLTVHAECPMTPDRATPVKASTIVEHFPVAPMGSPGSCNTPGRQGGPMMSPATACSERATSARGVATPLRAGRTRRVSLAQEEEVQPLLLRFDAVACGAAPIAGSTFKSNPVFLSDFAVPGLSDLSGLLHGGSPTEFAMPHAASHDNGTVQELHIGLSSSTHGFNEIVRDPRKRPQVSLPEVVVPLGACSSLRDPRLGQRAVPSALPDVPMFCASTVLPSQGSAAPASCSDPRRLPRRRNLGDRTQALPAAKPCKRGLSPEVALTVPNCPRSPIQPASVRARRYRSPTPGPDEERVPPSSRGSRYRSPTPGPSERIYTLELSGPSGLSA